MTFEGSEKKLELILNSRSKSLKSFSDSFFKTLLRKSNTQCLNQFESSDCKAYLLSESSLFVWDHRLTLITCGKTTLCKALLYLLKSIPSKHIEACFFQRKNEFFPLNQKTTFEKDVYQIRKKIKGPAYRFGELDRHHFFLFHLDNEFSPNREDQTVEILIYDMPTELKNIFYKNSDKIQSLFNFNEAFPHFVLQDHVFKPEGYSLNALRKNEYYTLHLTPQNQGFYMSFETNIEEPIQNIIQKVLVLFKPLRFDLITFTPTKSPQTLILDKNKYLRTSFCQKGLSCGFDVHFSCFQTVDFKNKLPYEW